MRSIIATALLAITAWELAKKAGLHSVRRYWAYEATW